MWQASLDYKQAWQQLHFALTAAWMRFNTNIQKKID